MWSELWKIDQWSLRRMGGKNKKAFLTFHHMLEYSQLTMLWKKNNNVVIVSSESENCSVISDSLRPHRLYSPWNSLGQNTGMGSLSLFQGDLPNPGIEPTSPSLWADSLPSELQGKPKNTGVGSLFLLQQLFPTQESNWGLLHCRQILYQLSYGNSAI